MIDNGMRGTLPDLTGLAALKTLSLSFNALTGTIPALASTLTKL